jgi:hypothetical protein
MDAGKNTFPLYVRTPSTTFQLALFGWSGGYLAFASDGGLGSDPATKPSLTTSSSVDGLHWTPARTVDMSGFGDEVNITAVAEGPSGLVAIGFPPPDTCGGPPSIAGLWRSVDGGGTWAPIDLPADMVKSSVQSVEGGSAGYIATGVKSDGKTPGIWVSQDARTWTSATLPKPANGTLVVNGATSFAGGMVVAGAVLGPEGCGGAQPIKPALWTSPDGTSWTIRSLPGASTAKDATLRVSRIDDHAVAAIQLAGDSSTAWVSTDGTAWTKIDHPTDASLYGTVSAADRAIAITSPESGPLLIQGVGDDLGLSTITQSGDGPVVGKDLDPTIQAVGPTGLLSMVYNGSKAWLGVPSS